MTNKKSYLDLLDELKNFNHVSIAENLEFLWGTKEFYTYMRTLMIMDRDYREGFKPAVFDIFLKLFWLHDQEFPEV